MSDLPEIPKSANVTRFYHEDYVKELEDKLEAAEAFITAFDNWAFKVSFTELLEAREQYRKSQRNEGDG